jgi:transketolase
VSVLNVPVIKPLDTETVIRVASGASAVITAENHSVIGGLGSAVAETMAEAGLGRPLRRIGLRDTFAEGARTNPFLFKKYGLGTQDIVDCAWRLLHRDGPPPQVPVTEAAEGEYAPV